MLSVRLRGGVFFYVRGSNEWAAEASASNKIAPLLMRGIAFIAAALRIV